MGALKHSPDAAVALAWHHHHARVRVEQRQQRAAASVDRVAASGARRFPGVVPNDFARATCVTILVKINSR